MNVSYRPELAGDDPSIEDLSAAVFGPGRFARTAYRLREGVPHEAALSFVALVGGALIGSVRLTPIAIGETPALLLGPLAVRPEFRSQAIGGTLMRQSMEAARLAGHRLVLLVGDLPYYYPFGFRVVPPGSMAMPGPVDPARLLVAELIAGAAAEATGAVRGVRPQEAADARSRSVA
jgi:predicted N-acetyltransferase YhbS